MTEINTLKDAADEQSVVSLSAAKVLLDRINANAFYVLAVPSTATRQETLASLSNLRRYSKLGINRPSEWDSPALGKIERTEAIVQETTGRLANLKARLEDRLFWFSKPLPSITLLTHADVLEAIEAVRANCEPQFTQHDMALLAVYSAVIVSPDLQDTSLWTDALSSWSAINGDDAYWKRLYEVELASAFEPAVNLDDVAALRSKSLEMILDFVVALARPALSRGDESLVLRAVAIIGNSTSDTEAGYESQQALLGPLEDSVASLCNEIAQECREAIVRDDEHTAANRSACERAMNRYATEVVPLLERMQRLTAIDTDLIESFARRGRGSVVSLLVSLYGAWTWADDAERCEQVLLMAREYGVDLPEGMQVAELLESVSGYAKRKREIRETILSDKTNQVTLKGTSYSTPQACVCCLDKTDRQIIVTGGWEESKQGKTIKHSVSFKFRECPECTKHKREVSRMETLAIAPAVVIVSVALILIYFYVPVVGPYFYFPLSLLGVLVPSFVSIVIAKAIGSTLKLSPIEDKHSTRGDAVSVVSASATAVTFEFQHPEYARVFAESNNSTAIPTKTTKYTRGIALMDGLSRTNVSVAAFLVPAGMILFFSFLALRSGYTSGDIPTIADRGTPAPFSGLPHPNFTSDSDHIQSHEIDQDNDYLSAEDDNLDAQDAKIKSLESSLNSLVDEVQAYDNNPSALDNNDIAELDLDRKTALADVAEDKQLVATYNADCDKHNSEHDVVEQMINDYNSRIDSH